MGDSTAMTIEFLRARLLSERSVSRSARQRADQLAKRVLDLEEQLRIVTIQRRKAEKAASEVLAILETQGVNDFPEVIDSSSDRDHITGDSKGSDENAKEDETSTASRMDRSDVEDGMSGSEIETSNPQGKSLLWKSCNNGSNSSEKRKEYPARQKHVRDFISRVGSSPQHLSGKSCRKIKSFRDKGNTSENGGSTGIQLDQTSDCADDEAQKCKETCDTQQQKPEENDLHSEDHRGHPPGNVYADEFVGDEAMEMALQQQAQLIVQYQAEERAQREWEEKYNENNTTKLASCNAAEGGDAPCGESKLSDETITSDTKMSNIDTNAQDEPVADSREGEAVTDSDGPSASNVLASMAQTSCAIVGRGKGKEYPLTSETKHGNGFQESEFPGPMNSHAETKAKQCLEPFDDNSAISSSINSNLLPRRKEVVGSESEESPSSSNSNVKFSKGQWSLIQSQIHRDLPEPTSSGVENVLDALQRAKLSLRQELNSFQEPPTPVSSGAWTITAVEPRPPAIGSADTVGIPFGSPGLFRLPTDTVQVDLPRTRYYDPGLGMPALRSFAGNGDGYPLNARSEARTAVASTGMSGVLARTGISTYTNGYATDLRVKTSPYGRLPNSYVGMASEVPGVDAHNVYSADRSRLDIFGVQRLQE